MKKIIENFFNRKTLVKVLASVCFALTVRYIVICYEPQIINNIWWIHNDYVYSFVSLIISSGKELISIIINLSNISKEPFEFIVKILNKFDNRLTINEISEDGLKNPPLFMEGNSFGQSFSSIWRIFAPEGSFTDIHGIAALDDDFCKGRFLIRRASRGTDELIKSEAVKAFKLTPKTLQDGRDLGLDGNTIYNTITKYQAVFSAQIRGYYTCLKLCDYSLHILNKYEGNVSFKEFIADDQKDLRNIIHMLGPRAIEFELEAITRDSIVSVLVDARQAYNVNYNNNADLVKYNESFLDRTYSNAVVTRQTESSRILREVNQAKTYNLEKYFGTATNKRINEHSNRFN